MKQPAVKSTYNIKFKLIEVITHKLHNDEHKINEVAVNTDINKWKVTYYSDGQYIKGIVETSTIDNVKFENRENIMSFSESGELQLLRRSGDDVLTNVIMGYFEYTRSINSIEKVLFNEFHNFSEKSEKAIYKNIVTLIEKKIDQERFEAFKKQNS